MTRRSSSSGRWWRGGLPVLARVLLVLLVGWASGIAGLWQAGAGPTQRSPGQHGPDADRVALAAPAAQAGDPSPAGSEAAPLPGSEQATPAAPADGGFATATATIGGFATTTPTIGVTGTPLPPHVPSPSPIPYLGDRCFGDEQITFVPEDPRTNSEVIVAVSSAYQNRYPRLAGTERTTFLRERPGQLGFVWEWTIQATWPGQHVYTYYVDSTVPCRKVELQIRQPFYTRTPTPTKTPKPTNENDD
ncbi:MAG: hypothetical protein IT306_16465 [Chloroflexi bacterium]|nr:hypothetical protein [Chloroflexota bacterium]